MPAPPRTPSLRARDTVFRYDAWEGGMRFVGAVLSVLGAVLLAVPKGDPSLFAGACLIAGATMLGVAWYKNRQRRRAFTHGVAAVGVITFAGLVRTTTRGSQLPKDMPMKVDYRFTDDAGRTFEGTFVTHAWEARAEFSRDQPIVILYDRADPRVSTVFVD